MADAKRKGLGRGLGALISSSGPSLEESAIPQESKSEEADPGRDGQALLQLDPRDMLPNPHQPRAHFDEYTLEELAESIRENG